MSLSPGREKWRSSLGALENPKALLSSLDRIDVLSIRGQSNLNIVTVGAVRQDWQAVGFGWLLQLESSNPLKIHQRQGRGQSDQDEEVDFVSRRQPVPHRIQTPLPPQAQSRSPSRPVNSQKAWAERLMQFPKRLTV